MLFLPAVFVSAGWKPAPLFQTAILELLFIALFIAELEFAGGACRTYLGAFRIKFVNLHFWLRIGLLFHRWCGFK